MKPTNYKLIILGLIIAGTVILLTLLAAPTQEAKSYGSTYGRTPEGYGAWYAYMQQRETPLKRLQKPLKLLNDDEPVTLLRIIPELTLHDLASSSSQKWIEEGNTLVLLGVYESATDAPFSSLVESEVGSIKIETSRRKQKGEATEILLRDRSGAIIWIEQLGKGQMIFSTAPYLAANAYQNFPNNYEFLAKLVTAPGKTIWVDEYIHGYKDREVIQEEIGGTVWSYLVRTPFLLLFIQGIILVGLAIWAGSRRMGRAIPLASPKIDNSEAYIRGLASVLQKADRSDFVVSMISQAERQEIQKILGLGDSPLTSRQLQKLLEQKGAIDKDLKTFLVSPSRPHLMKDKELLNWLAKWRKIKLQLTK